MKLTDRIHVCLIIFSIHCESISVTWANYSFVVPSYLFHNELTFLVTYDVIMDASSEVTVCRCSSKKIFLKTLQYSHMESLLESGLKACNFIKKRLQRKCFPVNIAKCGSIIEI